MDMTFRSYPFLRFGLISLFLCSATVHSAPTRSGTNSIEKELLEVGRIFRHLIPRDGEERESIEPMTTVMKTMAAQLNITELRVRAGFDYEGKSTIPLKILHDAVDQASLLEDKFLFQTQNPYHHELSRPLYELLYIIYRSQLDTVLEWSKKFVNKYLFHHILRVALLHRSDITLNIPSHVTLVPYMYFEMGDLGLKKYGKLTDTRIVLSRRFVNDPKSNDHDHRLEYFRLDPGMNSHHEHWHEANLDAGGYLKENWSVDRSGEMFYYMHSQMNSRYNFERLCCDVPLLKPLDNLHEPLAEPYFERLTTETRAKLWDSRPPNHKLTDVNLKGATITIQQIEMARDRILEAIDRGFVYVNQGKREVLEPLNGPENKDTESTGVPFDSGIDKLGYAVWSFPNKSINFRYYGSLHNSGHLLIGNNHDPEGLYHEQSRGSAMSVNYAAPRDPAFYRWHAFVDNIFARYKSTLPEYTTKELEFKHVVIEDLKVRTGNQTNVFKTGWVKDTVNITEGVSASLKNILSVNDVYYDFVHLDHEKYEFNLTVKNRHTKNVKGTVRIFLAPVYTDWKFAERLAKMDSKSREQALKRNPKMGPSFSDYRRMFIELDKFVLVLKPGTYSYYRKSDQSSVTIPYDEVFKTLEKALREASESEVKESLSWSGCGWPQYLQIPKGNEEGFPARLFIMISNFEKDKASDDVVDFGNSQGSMSYCGVPNKPQPDRKPTGFPFDRDYGIDDTYLHNFISRNKNLRDPAAEDPDRMTNMKVIDVIIKHQPDQIKIGQSIHDVKKQSQINWINA